MQQDPSPLSADLPEVDTQIPFQINREKHTFLESESPSLFGLLPWDTVIHLPEAIISLISHKKEFMKSAQTDSALVTSEPRAGICQAMCLGFS